DEKGVQVHAVFRPRVGGARARVHQGVSDRLPEVRHEDGHGRARGGARASAARAVGIHGRRRLRSILDRRHARHLRAARRQASGAVRRAPVESADSENVHAVEARRETRRTAARIVRGAGRVLPLHHRRTERGATADARGSTLTTLLRHPVYTRCVHWGAAAFFVLALLSGFAIYTPWLFRLLTPIFGGGPMTRLLHPWFSLGFVALFALQTLNWIQPMTWTGDDSRWLRQLKEYVTNAHALEPEYVDFFNAGQKLYFWTIVASAIIFLVSGIPMWFPRTFG